MKVDAVLSYHADPIGCGVTKFSQQLATRLDVPWYPLTDVRTYQCPLVSMKPSEIPVSVGGLSPHFRANQWDVFLHDGGEDLTGWATNSAVRRRFAANAALGERLRKHGYSCVDAWCPSLVDAHPREPITVLSFGMANKIRTDYYVRLKDHLDATGEPYVVYVSAALHEGTTFSDASASFETLRNLFGMNFVFLGTLSDEAMVDRLRRCTYVAAFFEHGLRENNTSVMAAIDHGATVITNWDAQTPEGLRHLTIHVDATLPHVARRQRLRNLYGWDALVELIRNA